MWYKIWTQHILYNTITILNCIFLKCSEPIGFNTLWWRKNFWKKEYNLNHSFQYCQHIPIHTIVFPINQWHRNILILYSWFFLYMYMGYVKPRLSYDSFIVTYIAETIACCCSCINNDQYYDVFTGLKHICLIMFILYVYMPFYSNKVIFICIRNIPTYVLIVFGCNPVFEK